MSRQVITEVYKDASAPVADRVADLLARMTLAEKAAQMLCVWQLKADTLVDEHGHFDEAKARHAFDHGHAIGQVGRPSDAGGGLNARATAELCNAIQKFFLENSRLGIPVMFHEECLHGHAAIDATSFSQPIGLAATFNPQLVQSLYEMTAAEARARGAHQALTPVVDVARDPRWGRVEETFGEDPYLVSRMGVAAVRGFQGDRTFKDKKTVIATLKHFAAHGQPESGMNCGPANVSMRVLRETFLATFKACFLEAGALSVMPSYNEIDGVPSHANRWLLRDVLREEWGFKGFAVSDYRAIRELWERTDTPGHYVAADRKDAARLAVKAGVNIEFPEPDCYPYLAELVQEGTLQESELDELIAPMLYWKFQLGLFEDPYVDPEHADQIVGCAPHREQGLRAARETITLLKNDNQLVPLAVEKLRTIAVIGPNAQRTMLGGYSGVPRYFVTVVDGIREKVGPQVNVLYNEGCKITIGGSWNEDAVTLSDPDEDRRQIAEAVEVAKQADVVVLAIGGNEQTSREAWAYTHMGDRSTLDLIGRQQELADAVLATGKPVIVLLFNGAPLSISKLADTVPVIFECWYLGQDSGRAIADVLFGDHNPGGKLPITIPRHVGQVPCFYNHKSTARRGYLFDDATPLYAFGYGLSYTTFRIDNVRLAKPVMATTGRTQVLADVTNTGQYEGTEVVQLYIRDLVSSVTRPIKELKGFQKVKLAPNQSTTVSLDITPESLAFYDVDMNWIVEPGEFAIMVGSSSRDRDLQTVLLTVTE